MKACNCLGVSTTGSQTDLINRLEELLLYKEVYPKMFIKLKKAGGKILFFSRHVQRGGGQRVLEHLPLCPKCPFVKAPFCEGLPNLTISKIND